MLIVCVNMTASVVCLRKLFSVYVCKCSFFGSLWILLYLCTICVCLFVCLPFGLVWFLFLFFYACECCFLWMPSCIAFCGCLQMLISLDTSEFAFSCFFCVPSNFALSKIITIVAFPGYACECCFFCVSLNVAGKTGRGSLLNRPSYRPSRSRDWTDWTERCFFQYICECRFLWVSANIVFCMFTRKLLPLTVNKYWFCFPDLSCCLKISFLSSIFYRDNYRERNSKVLLKRL